VVCSRTGNKLYSLGETWRTVRKNAGISEAREEARQVPPHEHRRVAVVGLARDVDARPYDEGAMHTLVFAPIPPMPSYLVVGDGAGKSA
jgi:hypothetical protein